MPEVFFDIQDVHLKFIPEGCTVNIEFYVNILCHSCESIQKKKQNLWTQSWVLLQGNTLAHRSLLVTDFLAKMKTTILPHLPYSPWSLLLRLQTWLKIDSKNVSVNFTSDGKSCSRALFWKKMCFNNLIGNIF